jgi:3-hydroxyisobutyrate dehydrogenase
MMGYPMALNIRKKIPSSSKLYIFDVSKAALDRFKEEGGSHGAVIVASSSKDVVDHAVNPSRPRKH